MSEGRTPTDIDPRFDPRFQRGYVPDAAAPASASVSPRPTAAPAPAPAAAAPALDADAAADDPTAAIAGLLAHAQAERLTRADPERDDGDPADDLQPEPDSPAFTAAVQTEPVAAPVVEASPVRWFWLALAVCVVFVLVGIALFWNGASDRSMFTAAPSSLEGAFNQFAMVIAPALVQAGVLGSIVVLVTWAITGRRSRNEAE